MSRGILEMVASLTTIVFVIPLAFAGVGLSLRGDILVGSALLGVGFGMIVADQYVTTPADLPILVVNKVVGAIVRTPDDE